MPELALKYLDDSGFRLGMIRDQSSWLLPPGATYDELNVVHDSNGILRQRGGTTSLGSTATAFCTSLGFAVSADATPIEELYGADGKTGSMYSVNKTTGAATSIGTPFAANSTIGRPVRHFGFLVFPGAFNRAAVVGGQTSSTTFTSTGTTTITAGQPRITLGGGDTTTNIKVGAYVLGITAPTTYAGRVVSIDSGTTFSVWPVPTASISPTAGSFTGSAVAGAGSTNGGQCAASFQNRLLFGNTFDLAALQSSGAASRADRYVNYGVLPTETGLNSTQIQTGAAGFIFSPNWPVLNFFPVPGSDPIVAMEPLADNALLILTSTHPVLFRGNLVTQLATTNPNITWDLSEINQPTGCLSDLSVQRTSKGIVWAGAGGIYAYSGGAEPDNLTRGLINSYWRSLALGSSFAVHGSMYVRGHYVISGSSGGSTFALACDLTGSQPRWMRLSGAGTDIFYGIAQPSSAGGRVFAARWWNQSGAAPSMTNGQVVRTETMLDAYVAGSTKTDSDGAAVPISVTTRTIGGDVETQKLFQRGTVRHAQSSTTAAVTVTAQSTIDAADVDASRTRALGSLSNTSTLTLSNATNANPITCTTTANHGLQTDDFVDIDAVLGNLNANGRWRIAVTGATTFTLVGGIGSANYTSGGKVKKLTETDYTMSSLNAGQGASLTVAGSPNNFELHGIRLAVLERAPVMSS